FPASMTGVWSGNLQQSDGKVWPMQVSIPGGVAVATVSYPSLGCAGTWTATSADTAAATASEHITTGACTERGAVELLLAEDGTLQVGYFPEGAAYTGSAVLARS
ncbi:MAG: hypothetical protein JXA67_12400, partial [Micromonosporaceae bacterium]|nr:hypothetical protein [Micromonosporaceae bacterium]